MKKVKFTKKTVKWLLVAAISVVAIYGFVIAPSKGSDHLAENLKQQFSDNQDLLEQQKKQQEKVEPKEQAEEDKIPEGLTLVGDSVMLGAVPELMEMLPEATIDAKESRQVVEAIDILKGIENEKKLNKTVVIELGINSYFTEQTGQEVIDYLGKDREIYWLTVYGKYLPDQDRTNDVIRTLAEKNKNVSVIDWAAEGSAHDDWFYNDGIHLNGAGRTGFATFVCKELGVKPEEKTQQEEVETSTGESE